MRLILNGPELLAPALRGGMSAEVLPNAWDRWSIRALRRHIDASTCDAIVIDCDGKQLARAALAALLPPRRRWRLIALDQVLPKPCTWRMRCQVAAVRPLLRAVDLFIFYTRRTDEFERIYRVPSNRVRFVPFKVNCWNDIGGRPRLGDDGEHVLVAGRSYRDLDTFHHAMAQLPYPAVVFIGDDRQAREHGTKVVRDGAPPNVRYEYNSGSRGGWLACLARARVLVLPVLGDVIAPSGISTMLDGFALGRPVVLTESAASGGVPPGSCITVPPRDASALATAIRQAWEPGETRDRLRTSALRTAEEYGGEDRLHTDILALFRHELASHAPCTEGPGSPIT